MMTRAQKVCNAILVLKESRSCKKMLLKIQASVGSTLKKSDFKSEIDFQNIKTCNSPQFYLGAVPNLFYTDVHLEIQSEIHPILPDSNRTI